MSESYQEPFANHDIGQVFRFNGSLYVKTSGKYATLLRDDAGMEPDRLIKHAFYPDEMVDPRENQEAESS